MNDCKVNVKMIHSESLKTDNLQEKLEHLDGLLVAPGFGLRGVEGKIEAIRYVREHKIPFFGICLGMQCMVIEFGRNILNMKDAHSTEMNPDTPFPVIDIMESQKQVKDKGGTMRLGIYPCELDDNSKVFKAYGKLHIEERHRHRYEFNNAYREQYREAGLLPVGVNTKDDLVEIVEAKDHPWFVGVQFHPEYKSTVDNPHPLFTGFIKAAREYSLKKNH